MKKYIIYAERVTSETLEIEAENEEQAYEKALEADNSEWVTAEDLGWEVTSAREVDE